MAIRVSRRKLAAYYAEQLLAGTAPAKLAQQLAAYLIDTRRTREYELVARDIETQLAARGTVVADITSAHPLTADSKANVTNLITSLKSATAIELREYIDPSVLAGVRIGLPGEQLDMTAKQKLNRLRALKV